MLKLIVFDWDGTLSDSVGSIIACKQFLAEKYGLKPPSSEVVKHVLGMKFEEALSLCFPGVLHNDLYNLGAEFKELMLLEHYQAGLFPHVKEVLTILQKRRIKLAVATSKSRLELDKAIIYNGLSGVFDMTCCGEEYRSKPNPAMLECILSQLYSQPHECLMVGDTTTDIIFAKNANIKIICATFGAHSALKLQAEKPAGLIDSWPQLLDIIDSHCIAEIR